MDNRITADRTTKLHGMNVILGGLLEAQCGVARRGQLMAAGLTRSTIRSHVSGGRWQALGTTVIVTHNGPLDERQRCWAATLSASTDALLAGLSALKASGLRGWESAEVHVLVPRAATRSVLRGVPIVRHETRRPAARIVTATHWPPRVTVERAAIDAASWRRDTRTAAALLAAVTQQRLTTPDRLRAALAAAGAVRHRRAMRLAVEDIAGGAQALSEIDFSRLCREYDLGTLVRQVVRTDGQGKRRYLDGEIVCKSGKRVAFEVDGGVHLLPESYWNDMRRQNELLIVGTTVLRFSSYAARFQRAAVADQIRRASVA